MHRHSTTKTTLGANSKSSSQQPRIFRSNHGRENPYVMVTKDLINDKSLSLECMAFLIFLLSKPADWNIHVSQLSSEFSGRIGEKKIYSLIREAMKAGYMKRVDILERGLKNGCNYFVSEEPVFREDFQKFQRCGKKRHAVNCRDNILSNDSKTNIQRHKEEAPQGDFPSKPIKKPCQKCTWHNPPESQLKKQVCAKKEPPKPQKPDIPPKPKEKKQPQVRILLPDGTIQLEKLPDNGFIPTPGSDKMVKELQEEVLCDAFPCGTSKFRIHRDDWYRFYGFSPATIRQAAYNLCKRSRNGEKIGHYTACLIAECAKIQKAKRG